MRLGSGVEFTGGNLRQRGGGAIHIGGALSGTLLNPGNLTIATDAGHMILSGNSASWRGQLTVNHGFLVATANGALGSNASNRTVSINGAWSGATLAFRPQFVGTGLNNSAGIDYATQQAITVSGQGYLRPWGSADPQDPYSALNLSPVGAIYNDGGNNTFAGNITMVGDTWFGSRHGVLTLTGRIQQSGGNYTFTKVGHGVVALGYNGTNTWSGNTVIREGALRLGHANSLASDSVIRFEGGILELGAADFSRTLGTTGSNRINWMSGRAGGFSAYGGERTVTLNNGATLNWGSGGFVGNGAALLLNSAYADNKITFANPINLYVPNVGSATREIRVERGATSAAHAVLSGLISSPRGGILKTGLGTLWLGNSSNSYAQATIIRKGVLGGRVPSNSRIDFDGGVLGVDGNFTRNLGTAGNQIRWLAGRDGGFASYSGTRTVTLGSANSIVKLGQANFVSPENYLIFGAYDATGTITFNNRLGLIGWDWTGVPQERYTRIRVIRAHSSIIERGPLGDLPRPSVVFTREFYTPDTELYTTYDLYFEGDGRADITHAHPALGDNGWTVGEVKTYGAHLVLREQANIPTRGRSPSVAAYHGGSITLDNTAQYVSDRIGDAFDVMLHSGKFALVGNLSTHVTETVQDLVLNFGANTVSLLSGAGIRQTSLYSVLLRFRSLYLNNDDWSSGFLKYTRPTVNFTNNHTAGFAGYWGAANAHRISFSTKPSEFGGILPYATVNGKDWARTEQGDDGRYYLTAYTNYNTQNVWYSQNYTLTANQNISSLKLSGGRHISSGSFNSGYTLTISSGGLLSIGSSLSRIQYGKLQTVVGRDLYAHIYNTANVGLDISSELSVKSARLVKTGPVLLKLSGTTQANIDDAIHINEGTLALYKTGAGKVNTSSIIVGDHAGVDVLRLDNHQQIVSTVNLTLRGGHPDPSRFLMAEGILRYNGINGSGVGIRQTINNLHIEGRGVIDFRGGEVGRANFLIINGNITFGEDSRLFIRNWYEYEDYILIHRNGAGLVNLSNIEFEGYGPTIFRAWDSNYYIITPMPEPTTYGAILGAVGIGLVAWRRRKVQRKD